MLHPSTQKLIDRLVEMTERGKLDWTEAEDQGVNYVTEGYSVTLVGEPVELVINSTEGKELERATAQELADTPSDSQGTYASVIASLMKAASRVARGTETAITSLLADMDERGDAAVETEGVGPEIATAGAEIEDIVDDTVVSTEDLAEPATERSSDTEEAATIENEASVTEPEAEEETAAPSESDGAETDAEPDMREAVARLANEVNGSGPDAANGETEHKYVPFGLAAALAMPPLSTGNEPAVDEVGEDIAPAEPAPTLDTPPADLSADQEPSPDIDGAAPDVEDQQIAPAVDISSSEEPAADPAAEVVEPAAAPAEFESEAPIPIIEDAPAAASAEPEPSDDQTPRSYSLSGIGAGFGFGALTATTEATGVPEATPAEPEDRIVIDATDEVALSDVESLTEEPVAEAIPEIPVPEPSVDAADAAEPAPADTPAAEEPADLKPRTRFNPWN